MTSRPITEDDLHAYVDGVLEPERQTEVTAYLEHHPEVARRVATFSGQRELLREAVRASLNQARRSASSRRDAISTLGADARFLAAQQAADIVAVHEDDQCGEHKRQRRA